MLAQRSVVLTDGTDNTAVVVSQLRFERAHRDAYYVRSLVRSWRHARPPALPSVVAERCRTHTVAHGSVTYGSIISDISVRPRDSSGRLQTNAAQCSIVVVVLLAVLRCLSLFAVRSVKAVFTSENVLLCFQTATTSKNI